MIMAYIDLTPVEKVDFIGKLIIAAQSDYFGECSEIINHAQHSGLFEKIKLSSQSHPEILDLDHPIEGGIK
jgi:hypothetical protein